MNAPELLEDSSSLSGLSSYYNCRMLSHSLSPNQQRQITSCAIICGVTLEQHIFCPKQ